MRLNLIALLGILCLTGCVSVRNDNNLVPPTGLITTIRAPIVMPKGQVDLNGLKRGESSNTSVHIQDWVFTGLSAEVCDMRLVQAAKNGGINDIVYADYEQRTYLGFVTFFSVIAYGY